jgi:hypothetical protein
MSIRLIQLSDNIRLAVLDGKLTIYFLDENRAGVRPAVALVSDDRVIGGIGLTPVGTAAEGDWYRIATLWADSAVASITLLYATLEHFKRIVSSDDISPAALSVVKRFYNKYKGTEVIQENVQDDTSLPPELAAGYVWSPKLKSVPVLLGQPKSIEEVQELKDAVWHGFNRAYSNPKRTKREDPDVFLHKEEFGYLLQLLNSWMSEGGSKERAALHWISQNFGELQSNDASRDVRQILKIYEDNVDY